MYAATGNEDPDVITILIDSGADVDAQTPAGWTALMYAVRDNTNPEVAERLLNLGADSSISNSDALRAIDYADENPAFSDSPAYFQLFSQAVEEVPEEPTYTPPAEVETQSCCKYCTTGKACGDSCISASYNCYKGVGCACNASDLDKNSPTYARLMMIRSQLLVVHVNELAKAAAPFVDCTFAAAFDTALLTASN